MKKSTKKQLLARILTAVMGFSLIGCAAESSPANAGAEETGTGITKEETAVEQPVEETDGDAEIRALISSMTTEEKLAQMMIVALRSDAANTNTATELDQDYTDLLRKYDFGGVILFAGNIVDPAQTVTMTRGIQEAAMGSDQGIPMLICVDQEGGMVNRVSFGTCGSGNMALAAAGDPALAEETARILGDEIKALGFNMDFAPVSDVNSNPANPIIGVRSFSDDPQTAAEYVTAFMKGLDAACYEEADAVLCAYQPYGSAHDAEGNGPFNLNVAVALCTVYNEAVPAGTLPVNVPKITGEGEEITFEDELLYERGSGLELWGD